MRVAHADVGRIPVADLAVMIDIGWVREWPFEIRPAAVRYIKRNGWDEAMRRAYETAARLRKIECEVRDVRGLPGSQRALATAEGRGVED
jgi:hypothetical protein